jgi:hypothetical protein
MCDLMPMSVEGQEHAYRTILIDKRKKEGRAAPKSDPALCVVTLQLVRSMSASASRAANVITFAAAGSLACLVDGIGDRCENRQNNKTFHSAPFVMVNGRRHG